MQNRRLVLLAILMLSGCATAPVPVKFPVSPNMATTYVGNETTVTWKAELQQTYTVYYTDALPGTKPDWKPLPQATGLTGNGKQITIRDQVGPNSKRRYLLMVGDQKPF